MASDSISKLPNNYFILISSFGQLGDYSPLFAIDLRILDCPRFVNFKEEMVFEY